jgi:hypothetical protein
VHVPAATIARLEVQSGNRTGRGFVIGTAVVGVVVVPFYVMVGGSLAEGETRTSLVVKGVLVSALIGGGLGALIGHGHPTWAPAP